MLGLGVYQQGDVIPLRVQCVDGDHAPVSPGQAPVVTVYGPTGAVLLRVPMAADLQGIVDGNFRYPYVLGEDFDTPGVHTVLYQWTDGTPRSELGMFLLQPGGNSDGAVTALYPYNRPESLYLIRLTEAGLFARGRNPR